MSSSTFSFQTLSWFGRRNAELGSERRTERPAGSNSAGLGAATASARAMPAPTFRCAEKGRGAAPGHEAGNTAREALATCRSGGPENSDPGPPTRGPTAAAGRPRRFQRVRAAAAKALAGLRLAALLVVGVTPGLASAGAETITVDGAAAGLSVMPATLRMQDNDAASTSIALSLGAASVSEAAGTQTVEVTAKLNGAASTSAVPVTVSVGQVDDTAIRNADYREVSDFELTILANALSGTASFTLELTDDSVAEGAETITVVGSAAGLSVDSATLTLDDNDAASTSLSLSVAPVAVSEADASASVRVTAELDGNTSTSAVVVTVSVGASGDTAASGQDYQAVSRFELTIPPVARSASASFVLRPTDDEVLEGAETITVDGLAVGLSVTPATLTLDDDEEASTVLLLAVNPASVAEDGGATSIKVTAGLNGPANDEVTTVTLSVGAPGDTAASGTDYQAIEDFSLTIEAGQTRGVGTFTLRPTDDRIAEGAETITVDGAAAGLTVVSATLRMQDDDEASTSIALSLGAASVSEADGTQTVEVTAELNAGASPSAVPVTVSVGQAGDTAIAGADYREVSDFELTIPAHALSGTATFTLELTDDSVAEGAETITVVGSATGLSVDSATLTLDDNDAASTSLSLSVAPVAVSEADASASVRVTAELDGNTSTSAVVVTVSVGASGDTAASGQDYQAVSSFELTIPPVARSASASFVLRPTDDEVLEGAETITVDGLAVGLSVTPATLTLDDDEKASTAVLLAVNPASVAEDGGATSIEVVAGLNGAANNEVTTVTVTVGAPGDPAASGTDYQAIDDFSLTIEAGQIRGVGTFTLRPTDDRIAEGAETITVDGAAAGLSVDSATLTLDDDDEASTSIALSLGAASVSEAAGTQTVEVTAELNAGASTSAVAVTVSVGQADDTAVAGADYREVSEFELTILANALSGTATFTLEPTDDSVAEGAETITVVGSAAALSVDSATLTLDDDDEASTSIALSLGAASVSEAAGTQTVEVTAELNAGASTSAVPVTVSVGQVDDTAIRHADYREVSDFELTIPAHALSGTATFTLELTDDSVAEGAETITVVGSASGLSVDSATLTLDDNDAVSTSLSLSVAPVAVSEADASASVEVTAELDGNTSTSAVVVTVSVGASGDTAASGQDYQAVSRFELTIPPVARSASASFVLRPTDDEVVEGAETITIGGTASGLTVGSASLRLNDDDTALTSVSLSLDPAAMPEDGGARTVEVTAILDAGASTSAVPVTVSVGQAGDTAIRNADYREVSDFELTIPAHALSGTATFTLEPTDDSVAEGAETITVVGSATGLSVDSATLTLDDNDAASTSLSLSVAPVAVSEADASASVRVTAELDGNTSTSAVVVTVSVGASGDTAASGQDYQAVSRFELTIPPVARSASASFVLRPTDDEVLEGAETITVDGLAVGLSVTPATLTLDDDEKASTAVLLAVNPASVAEDGGATSIKVTAGLNGPANDEVTTVTLSVGAPGDTAASGTDYQAIEDFSLTIEAGQTRGVGTFTLRPTDDRIAEGAETITVDGAAAGLTVVSATLRMQDDDEASTSIALSLGAASVSEADGTQTVEVTAELDAGASPSAVPVTVSVGQAGDTAIAGADYREVSDFELTIPAHALSGTATFTLEPTDDSVAEGAETITVVGSATGLSVDSATLTLDDNDAASTSLSLSVAPVAVSEADASASVRVTAELDGNTSTSAVVVTVSVGASGDTAASGQDYQAVSRFELTIPPVARSASASFVLRPTDDEVLEGAETITVDGLAVGLSVTPATLTLDDDEKASTAVLLAVNPASVAEDGGATSIEVVAGLNGAANNEVTTVTVTVGAPGDPAASGTDYQAIDDFSLTIEAGQIRGVGTFTLRPTDDRIAEGAETITVDGAAAGLSVDSATLTLDDDDEASTSIALSLGAASVSEAAGTQTVEVTAELNAGASTSAVAVTVSVGQADDTAVAGADYREVSEFELTILANALSGTATFTLEPTDDSVAEGAETITVVGSAAALSVDSATLTLDDDDEASTSIALSLGAASVSEAAGTQTVEVTAELNAGASTSAVPVTVSVGQVDDTAIRHADYREVSDFELTIPAHALSGTATFTLELTDDSVAEGAETITVVGSASGLSVDSATLTLDDNDAASTSLSLSVAPVAVSEADASASVEVTAELDGNTSTSAVVVTVSVGASGDTAASGQDYQAVSRFELTIPPVARSASASFVLRPTDDEVLEGAETITIGGTASGLTVGSASLRLNDDDTALTSVSLSLDPAAMPEDGGARTVEVTAILDAGASTSAVPVTVSVGQAGDTAIRNADYREVSDFELTIPAHALSGTATFTLEPTDDSVAEGAETITVVGSATGLSVDSATLTLDDNDAASTSLSLSVAPVAVSEADASASVRVTAELDGNTSTSAVVVTVSVGASGDTAASGQDYQAVSRFELTIPPVARSASASFVLRPTDDEVLEGAETITVDGLAVGLSVTPATLTLDDDEKASTAVLLAVNPASVAEDGGATSIKVTAGLNGPANDEVTTVTLSVGAPGDTAASGTDYQAIEDFSLTIEAGQTRGVGTFTLRPTDDRIAEGAETITVDGAAAGLTVVSATLRMQDDDEASTSIALSLGAASVSEADGTQTVEVTAELDAGASPSAVPVTVSVGQAGDTAIAGADYREVSDFELTIPAHALSGTATFTLEPTDDSVAEGAETITVVGSATGLSVDSATLTLDDNDAASTSLSLSVAPVAVSEADASASVRVTAELDGNTSTSAVVVTVSVGASGDTAASGQDYQAVSRFELTIPPVARSASASFVLRPTDDEVLEGAETITVDGLAVGLSVTPATLTLDDDEKASTAVLLAVNPASVAEDGGATSIEVVAGLNGAANNEVTTVTVTVGAPGDPAASGTDYQAIDDFSLTIEAGQIRGVGTFTLRPTDDRIAEGAETITVDGAAAGLSVDSATLTLDDDDEASTSIALSLGAASVSEAAGTQTVEVTAELNAGASTSAVAVTVSVGQADDTAVAGADYREVSEFELTILANALSGTATFTLEPTDDSVAEGAETITVVGSAAALSVDSATLTLDDDDEASTSIALSLGAASVSEAAGTQTVEVTAELNAGASTSAVPVTVSVGQVDDTAIRHADYREVSDFELTIPAHALSGTATFTLELTDDSVAEGAETITVVGSASGLSVDSATLTLDDNDAASTSLSLSVAPVAVSEADASASVEVTAELDGNTSTSAVVVTVSVGASGDTAASGQDYQAVSRFELTIPPVARSASASFVLRPTDDEVLEGAETITIGGTASGLTVGSASLRLNDDDTASTSVSLSLDPAAMPEDGGARTVELTGELNGAAATQAIAVTVSVGAAGDPAASGTDYQAVADFTLTIPAEARSGTATFTLEPTDDSIAEGAETITVDGSAAALRVDSATLTLDDDDAVSTSLSLSVAPVAVSEADASASVEVTAELNGAASTDAIVVTVSVGAAGDSAASGQDYQAVADFTLTIPAEARSGTATFTLEPTDDSIAEGAETITVDGSAAALRVDSATLTLDDDDAVSTSLSLSVAPVAVSEADASASVEVTAELDGNTSTSAVVVTVAVGAPGDTAASGQDYQAVPRFDLTIPAEARSASASFVLRPTDDEVFEGAETITIGGTASGLTVGSGSLSLNDDDTASTSLSLAVAPVAVSEADASASVEVTAELDGAASTQAIAVTVSVGAAGDSAASGTDYQAVADFTLTIPAEARSGTATFTLEPTDDSIAEGAETITVDGSAAALRVDSATLTLDDDDAVSTSLSLSVAPVAVSEADASASVEVTAELDGNTSTSAVVVTVSVGAPGDTAASGQDYQAVSRFELTIPAEARSASASFILRPTDDEVFEGAETITIGGTASGLTVGSASLSLNDDDTASTSVSLSLDPAAMPEDGGARTVEVTGELNGAASTQAIAVTVSVGAAGDSAASGKDYRAVADFTLTIPAGALSGTATFTLEPTDDSIAEGAETITVDGSAAGLRVDSATLTLDDSDAVSTSLSLSVAPVAVSEADASASVEVTAELDGNTSTSAVVVTVSVGAPGDTAASGQDYQAVSRFDLTIPAEARSARASFLLRPTDDEVFEGAETITIGGTASGLTVGSASLRLNDDDTASTSVSLSLDPAAMPEDGGARTVELTGELNGAAATQAIAVTVSVGAAGDSAASGTDYQAVADFTLTIPAEARSGTATFTLEPTDDSIAEGAETITVDGSAAALRVDSATLTLDDDDAVSTSLSLSVAPVAVSEADASASVEVTAELNGAASTDAIVVTVSVGAAGDSAASGQDYQAVADFTLTIPAEARSGTATFTLEPTDDSIAEGAETITVDGSAAGLSVDSATLTLDDDDAASTSLSLSVAPVAVSEADASASVEVTAELDGSPSTSAVVVTVSVGAPGDTAASGQDYQAVSRFDLTIPAEARSASASFLLRPTDDEVFEGAETITIGGTASGLTVGSASLSLNDDDTASTSLSLAVAPVAVSEADASASVEVTAELDGAASTRAIAVTVSVGAAGDSAASGTDYQAVADFTLTIPAEARSGTATFTLRPVNDRVAEGRETLTVAGSAAGRQVEGAVLTLTDDDTASISVALSVRPGSVSEGDSPTSIQVTAELNDAARTEPTPVTVSVGAPEDSAASATDYQAVNDFTLIIPAASHSASASFTLRPMDDEIAEGAETITLSGNAAGLAVGTADLTLNDDDAASTSLSLSLVPRSVSEDGGEQAVEVTAELNAGARPGATTVTVSVGAPGDTASSGGDYGAISDFTLTIPAGQQSAETTFALTPENDGIAEGPEAISVVGRAAGLAAGSANLILDDDDTASTSLALSVNPNPVSESVAAQSVTVTANLNGGTRPDATTIQVRVGATGDGATEGDDYESVPEFPVTIPAGSTSGTTTFTLAPRADEIAEGPETITVDGSVAGLTVEAATLTLADDDTRSTSITLSVSPAAVSESDTSVAVTVTAELDQDAGADPTSVRVSVGTMSDSAASGDDYGRVSDFVLTIPAGARTATGTFRIEPTDDRIAEGPETITIQGSAAGLVVQDATLTLDDDDAASASVALSLSPGSVSEDDQATSVEVTAELNAGSRVDVTIVTVSVGAVGDSAVADSDYQAVSSFTLEIAPGATNAQETFELRPTDDEIAEGSETITVEGAADGLTVQKAELTLRDDDTVATSLSLSLDPVAVSESGGARSVEVTAELNGGARTAATTVTVSVGAPGDPAESGTDYESVPAFELTIPEGTRSATEAFTLTLRDDHVAERPETITVGGSANGLTVEAAELTVNDDDAASTSVSLSLSPASLSEDGGNQDIEVTAELDGAARPEATLVIVSVGAPEDAAVSGTDYQAVSDFTLEIGAGSRRGIRIFALRPVNDEIAEGPETIKVRGAATGVTVTEASLTLNDDDAASTGVELTLSPASVQEDAGPVEIEVTARLNGATLPEATVLRVWVGAPGDSADSGTDYQVLSPFTLTIDAESQTGAATFRLTPTEDEDPEGAEMITVGGSAVGLRVDTASITLSDDGASILPLERSVRVTLAPATVSEADEPTEVVVTAELAGAPALEETRFEITVGDPADSAVAGQDYHDVQRFVVMIGGGQSRGSGRFRLSPIDDTEIEGAEMVTVVASPHDPGMQPARALLELTDDDHATVGPTGPGGGGASTVSSEIRIADAQASEGAGTMYFTVRLDAPAPAPISLEWGTQPASSPDLGAATEGADYVAASGTLLIPTGRTSGRIGVRLSNDPQDELDERFEVVLYSSSGGEIVDDVGVGTILDDDGPELAVDNVQASESAGSMEFTVSLSKASVQAIAGRIATSDETATAGADYRAVETAFEIRPGQLSRVVRVPVLNDSLDEDDETFVLAVADVRNAVVVEGEAVGTIEDDDATPALLIADHSAAEGDGEIAFQVWLSVKSGRAVTVDYATAEVTARDAEDFEGVSGTLEFAAGELSKRVVVGLLDDDLDEENETFQLELSAPTNAILEVAAAVGTIEDDDAEPSLRIDDARASENAAAMSFRATLDAAAGRDLSYSCWTTDGEALASEDYEGQRLQFIIPAGAMTAVVAVPLVDDSFDEAEETFTVSLTNPREAGIGTLTAVGTIEDDDENERVARMWITRFGRTVATQVVESVENRLDGDSRGSRLSVGLDPMQTLFQFAARDTRGESWETMRERTNGTAGLDSQQLLGRSSFLVQQDGGAPERRGRWAAWGRGATLRFSGEEDGISINGDVLTTTAGVDYRRGRLLAGVALANSLGTGRFGVAGSEGNGSTREGPAESRITTLNPYLSVPLGNRISVWGLGGYGLGTMSLAAEEGKSDLQMRLGAIGARGDLWPGVGGSGVQVALKADAFWTRMDADATAVRLASTGTSSRGRIVAEGSRRLGSLWGGDVTPIVEAGLRYDGGDAETGLGLEVGSGFRYQHPARGLSVELTGRTLVAHQDAAYREWGVGGTVRLDPGSDRRGLSLALASSQGDSQSGVNQLWTARSPMTGGSQLATASSGRLEAEVGYGFGSFAGGSLTPYAGVSWQEGANRAFRIGSRLQLGSAWHLSLEGSRRQGYLSGPDHTFLIRGHLR